MGVWRHLHSGARAFGRNLRGNVAVAFALAMPVLLGAAGLAIDYANLAKLRTGLQHAADSAALSGAREMRLANIAAATVESDMTSAAAANLKSGNYTVAYAPQADMTTRTARMTLTATAQTYALQTLTSMKAVTVSASSAAQIKGGDPICVIGLNSSANFTVKMEKYAQLQAPNCVVYSNSTNANGLMAMNDAKLTAAMTCSAGGKAGAGPGSFSPTPQTDCPVMPDPLAGRLKPAIGTCSYNNLVVSGQMTTLYPGVYCGGLTITDQSIVTMAAGQYIIKDGPLVVTNAATMNGVNTGFFFTGTGALLNLDALSSISLTAPAAGAMAGMLFWEDAGAASGGTHQIISNDARTLLGTIYLPVNRFHVAANAPVADHSAYTVVVANQFSLSEGPTLVLNTNYGATNIPVPNGVGPGGTSMLIK